MPFNKEERVVNRGTRSPQEQEFEDDLSRLCRQIRQYEKEDITKKQNSMRNCFDNRPLYNIEGGYTSVAHDAFETQRTNSREEQLKREMSEFESKPYPNVPGQVTRNFSEQNIQEPSINIYKTENEWIKVKIDATMRSSQPSVFQTQNRKENNINYTPTISENRDPLPPSMMFSSDAQRIVNKYTENNLVPSNISLAQIKENLELADQKDLTEKMRKIKSNTSNISKTLAAIAESSKYDAKKEEEARAAQQYEDLYNEIKCTYEPYIKGLEEKVNNLEATLKEKMNESETTETKTKKQLKIYQKSLLEKENEILALREQLNKQNKEIQQIQDRSEFALTEKIKEIEELKYNCNINRQELLDKDIQFRREIEILNEKLKENKSSKKEQLKKQESMIHELSKQNESLRFKLEEQLIDPEREHAQKAYQESKAQIQSLSIQVSLLQSKKEKKKLQVKLKDEEMQSIKFKLQKSEESLEKQLEQNKNLALEVHKWKTQVEFLKKEIAESEQRNKVFTQQLTHLNHFQENSKVDVDRAEESSARKQYELEASLAELQNKHKVLLESNSKLQNQYEATKEENIQLLQQIKQYKTQASELQEQIDENRSRATQQLHQSSKVQKELSLVISNCEQRVSDLKKKSEEMKKANQKLREKNEKLRSIKTGLEFRVQEAEGASSTYKKQYLEHKKLSNMLKDKLNSIEEDVELFMRQREQELKDNLRQKEEERSRELFRAEAMKDVRGKINQLKTERLHHTSPFSKK